MLIKIGGGAFVQLLFTWTRGGYVKCPRLSTRGGEGVKNCQNLVHVVVECPLIFPVYLTKQSKNYASIHFSTELKPPEDIVLNDRKSISLSIGWKTPKGPFIYYVITCKEEGGGGFYTDISTDKNILDESY